MTVIGWKLDRAEREDLLRRFPPRYPEAVADHVTLEKSEAPLPPEVSARIVGRADDGAGVEAMVVALDGSTFHITWSLAPGRRAVESNEVLKERGWDALDRPVPVTVKPARF